MPGLCRAPGCGSPTTSRYSIYCSRHQSRLRRQGDVAQQAISKAELNTYLKRVRQRIAKNPDSPAWGQLETRWLSVVEHANGMVAASRAGKAGVRYVRKAAEEVLKVAAVATPRDVIETVLAMSMMEELDRRRFRSDPGFRFQLVRRVRALADVSAGRMYDHRSGKVRRVYRELTPRAVATIGQWLADMIGGAVIHLARLEVRDIEEAKQQRQALWGALEELK
jgi:hypothetical protein